MNRFSNILRIACGTALFVSIIMLMGCAEPMPKLPERGFWSETLVDRWENAMVSGNGVTGVLVYGNPHADTLIMSSWDLYMPLNEPLMPVNTGAHLDSIRSLMLDGKYGMASELVVSLSREEGYGNKRWTDPFVPGFDFIIRQPSDGEPRNYRRSVNYMTGEVAVTWEDDAGLWLRRVFVSRADTVTVVSIKNLSGNQVDFSIALDRRPLVFRGYFDRGFAAGEYAVSTAADHITYACTFMNRWEGSLRGYEGAALVKTPGAMMDESQSGLRVSSGGETVILIDLRGTYEEPGSGTAAIVDKLESISGNYEKLLKRHTEIHGELFGRVRLDLDGNTVSDKSAVESLLAANRVSPDFSLIEKQFDAGRYNILSSSGINPPNLQGIWAGSWASDWSGDYTQNGNLQVAISSMMSGNMPELIHSYFRYQERFMDDYRVNATRLYGARGINIASRTTTHGLNNHFDRIWPMTFWTAGAGWAAGFYYDYWLYTGDENFLREKAFPFMKEAALFYEDFLIKDAGGQYIFVPSYSPENNPAGSDWQACVNATMDVMVARQLLRNCIDAATVLGDTANIEKWKDMLSSMPPYDINSDGALREWLWPGLEDNYSHRHASHLYAFFDMADSDLMTDSELREASRIAVEKRMEVRRNEDGGIMAFGLVQLAMAAAALGEGEQAWEAVKWLSLNYWSPSLVTTHDPGHIFNLDLSGGFPALIIRMLAYSEPGRVFLLPAKPVEWKHGSVEGLLLRGGINLERLEWRGDTINAVLVSETDCTTEVYLPAEGRMVSPNPGSEGTSYRVVLNAGKPVQVSFITESPKQD